MKALLVSVKTPQVSELAAQQSVLELERLVSTLGFEVVATERQKQSSTHKPTVVGKGKLKTLAEYTGADIAALDEDDDEEKSAEEDSESEISAEMSADVTPKSKVRVDKVIFDCDLSPSQMKNLEKALGVEVLDRSGVIIEIFSRHARTREARLQVEMARLKYLAPRIRETGGNHDRQAGRGAGESQLELDRRKIRDQLTELKQDLALVQKEQSNRRNQRSDQYSVALVGYTNAGKSSTMRALTSSDVLVEDKLFATLDTTVRALQPETHPRILVSDTVGFINNLPHDLIVSFRSTFEEAAHASLLLTVVDASDPLFRSQLQVVEEALADLAIEEARKLLILNKVDRLADDERDKLQKEFPKSILISAKSQEDITRLRSLILEFFEKDMVEEEILAGYSVPGLVGEIRSSMRVLKESFDNEGSRLTVRARPDDLDRLKKKYSLKS